MNTHATFSSLINDPSQPTVSKSKSECSLEGMRILVIQSGGGGARSDFTSPSLWGKVR